MAFVIKKDGVIKRRIECELEGDLGRKIEASFVIIFKRPSVKESKKFGDLFMSYLDAVKAFSSEEEKSISERRVDIDKAESDLAAFVRERITGWDEVYDDEQQAIPFSATGLEMLFNDSDARRAVFNNFQQLALGAKAEAVKNSEASADTGS